jgi:hypothetical protein
VLFVFLCLSVLTVLEIFLKGHWALAGMAAVFSAYALAKMHASENEGAWIQWRGGQWDLGLPIALHGNDDAQTRVEMQPATLARNSLVFSWAVYLALKPLPDGSMRHLWIFRDSLGEGEYRRLRILANQS